jgi:hypothetical protein
MFLSPTRHSSALPAIVGAALCACVVPSDQSDQLNVTIETPATLLVRGRTMVLRAHAWQQNASGAQTELTGVAIQWSSAQPDLANVEGRADGTGLVTPVNEGLVEIRAIARGFENVAAASVQLRVANPLVIDSVRPTSVHYGEQITLFGVGLGDVIRGTLGQADLIPDLASFSGDPQGLGRQSYWVPYPAQTDRLVAVSRRGSTTVAPESTEVRVQDLYHELQLPPPRVDLGSRPVRGLDTLFYNPALAVVPDEGIDAFEFHREAGLGSLTFTFATTAPAVTLFDPVLTADPTVPASFPPDGELNTWGLGLSGQQCRDGFIPLGRPVALTASVTIVRALKDLPLRNLLLGVYGNPPGTYAVTVQEGYVTADPRIGADRLEENDYCAAADSNAANPDRAIVLPLADTLTIDNPYEVDWIRFVVPGDPEIPDDALITVRTVARPFGASDSSDVDLLVVDPEAFTVVEGESRNAGSSEALTVRLLAGVHYLVVFDKGGVATRYSLCVAVGNSCTFIDGT